MGEAQMETMEEDEVLSCPFSAAEMWQRLPLHLLGETVGYHPLQKASQLSWVSAAWNYSLSFLAVSNKDVVLCRPARSPSRDDDYDQNFWQGLSYIREGTIKHLVWEGFLPSAHAFVHSQNAKWMTFTDGSHGHRQDLSYGFDLLRKLGQTINHHLLTTVAFCQGVSQPALEKAPRGKSGIRALF